MVGYTIVSAYLGNKKVKNWLSRAKTDGVRIGGGLYKWGKYLVAGVM